MKELSRAELGPSLTPHAGLQLHAKPRLSQSSQWKPRDSRFIPMMHRQAAEILVAWTDREFMITMQNVLPLSGLLFHLPGTLRTLANDHHTALVDLA